MSARRWGWIGVAMLTLAVPPAAGAAATEGFVPPTPVVRTLANGLTVAVFRDDRLPIVQIQVLVPAGAAQEPAGQAGLANLTAQMLTHGTSSRTAQGFASAVEGLGGGIGVAAGLEFSTVTGSFLASDFEAGIELVADAVLHPLFSEEELQPAKNQIALSLSRARQLPATLADEHLWAMIYPNHPYGRSPQGSLRALTTLGLEQVRIFHRERYRPDHALLAIAGDVEPERAFRVAEEMFGSWGGRAEEWHAVAPAAPAAGWRVRIVDVPGRGRAELRFGAVGPAHGAKDFEALGVASEVLAAPEAGMRGSVVGLRDGGLVSIATSAPVDSVAAQVARVRAGLTRWTSEPPSESATAAARRRLIGAFPLRFETLTGQSASWMADTFYGLPADATPGYPRRVGHLAAAELKAAASHWVAPDRMVLVAVGPADRLRPQLESLGTVEVVSAEAAAEIHEAPSTAMAAPTAEQLAKGRAVADQAIAAHGGLDRLRTIKDSRLEGSMLMTDGAKQLSGELVQLRLEPMQFAFSTTFATFRSVQVLDGDKAWSTVDETPPRYEDLDDQATSALRSGFRSDLQHLLVAAADPKARVAWRGVERVADQDADVVEMVAPDGDRRVLFLDMTSHRLVAMEQSEGGHSARRQYRDFRDVNGVLWPFGEDRLLDGQRVVEVALRRVAFNTGLRPDQFHKPSTTPGPAQRPRPR